MIETKKTIFPEGLVIQPRVFKDHRGIFLETFSQAGYAELGLNKPFVQDNISRSSKNVLRGLHYQIEKPQAKLVSCVRGEIFDVMVDIRKDSPTFGKWHGEILSDENRYQLYIPEGFAHGFCVLSDIADVAYKCTDYYYPQGERGIRYDDPLVNIQWPMDLSHVIISDKDKVYPGLNA